MPQGRVTRIEAQQGFGWLVDDAGLDWFFVSGGVRGAAMDALAPGQRVSFSYEWTPKGPRAADVHDELQK